MANPVYHNGSDGKVKVQPSTASSFIEIGATKWDLTDKANNKDVSNSKDGRYRIKGVGDYEGNVSLHFDTANLPSDPTASTGPNLRPGVIFQFELIDDGGAGGTDSFRGTAIIDEVHSSSEFEGTIDYEVKFSQQSGVLKYPGDA